MWLYHYASNYIYDMICNSGSTWMGWLMMVVQIYFFILYLFGYLYICFIYLFVDISVYKIKRSLHI